MSRAHPTDDELLLHLDGGPPAGVAEHVAGCPRCRDALDAAAAGRDALRSTQLLRLPAARREAVLAALPRQERPHAHRRLLGAVLALVALASVVGAVALTGQNDPERSAQELRRDAERDAPAAALEAGPAEDDAGAAAVRSVAGPAEEVAGLLREAGLEARVVDGDVEVTGATEQEVTEALRGREPGDVEVRVRP